MALHLSPPQRRAFKRIYSMAVYASGSIDFGEYDEDNHYLGIDPEVERDLETVRRALRIPKKEG